MVVAGGWGRGRWGDTIQRAQRVRVSSEDLMYSVVTTVNNRHCTLGSCLKEILRVLTTRTQKKI